MRSTNLLRTMVACLAAMMGVLILMPAAGQAQLSDITKDSQEENLQFFVDYASFQSNENKVYLEVYLLIPRSEFDFVMSDSLNRYVAHGYVQVGLAQDDSIRYLDQWPLNDSVEQPEEVTDTQNIPDISKFEVPPGNYELIAQVIDAQSKKRGLLREPITLNSFDAQELTISDIEFASRIEMANNKTLFTKARRDIVPNASLTFGIGIPVLYSYAEIYNLDYPADEDSFQVQYSILDLNNAEVKAPQTVMRKKGGDSGVDIGGLNTVGLPGGIYFYRIKVTDLATGAVATRSKKFYVYKPSDNRQPLASASGLNFSTMGEEELDNTYNSMTPLLTNKEKRNFKRAGVEGKRNLLTQFWEKRDPDPSTQINELQIEYSKRLEYVNQNFGNQRTEGYDTDRGRVYLIYGEPDEVDRNPLGVNTKPYEIWQYHSVQGGVEFVFVDRSGFGVYELVHSTARNEIYDPNWQEYIQASPGMQGASGY